MVQGMVRAVRLLAGVWLVIALLLASSMLASAQSTMDPSIDSDGDGSSNATDFDDDNDHR